jgi:hypothetical protein
MTRQLPDDIEALISGGQIKTNGNGHQPPPPLSPDDYGIVSRPRGIGQAKEAKKPPRADWRKSVISSDALQTMTFPPLDFVVPGLIPAEGLSLICSKPKVGKSWLVLDMAIGATMNRFVLGDHRPKQGAVLYLALEDSRRRLQSRMTKLLGGFSEQWPSTLTLSTEWARLDQGCCDDIRAWVEDQRSVGRTISFVAVDVLKTVRPPKKAGQSDYDGDYDAIRALQQLALELSISIIVVHHLRKAEGEDFIDRVSGTFGIVGAADAILIIDRDAHGLVFDIRGRDVESNTFAAEFRKETCRWTLLGDAATVHQSRERHVILAVLREEDGPLKAAEVSEAGTRRGLWNGDPPSHEAIKKTLQRMAADGIIKRAAHGKYEMGDNPPEQSPDVPMDEQEWNEFE